eukprot:GHVU01157752.1.p2 GENE.GHVU01157752.1~~GHVU01157752.1.p2  ORF type:complete len:141 (+),score=12.31 GHVU01157752.1:349-771(+)
MHVCACVYAHTRAPSRREGRRSGHGHGPTATGDLEGAQRRHRSADVGVRKHRVEAQRHRWEGLWGERGKRIPSATSVVAKDRMPRQAHPTQGSGGKRDRDGRRREAEDDSDEDFYDDTKSVTSMHVDLANLQIPRWGQNQ